MDLLFAYKGGDEFMNNVLLYFALKHDGDFEKIYNDIKEKVPVVHIHWPASLCQLFQYSFEFIKLKRGLKTKYVTILDNNYPKVLKQIACPPFVLFYEGNIRLAKDLVVGDAFIYSSFNNKRYLSTVEPSADRGKFCFDYIIASESHDEFFNIREHVMDKKVPLKDYSKNTKHKQQER